jgi:glycosyltransferase involved in cell wall biosynthesis
MTILANRWVAKGWEITLLSLDDGSIRPFFPLDPGVRHRPLGLLADSKHLWMGLCNNVKRLTTLRKAIRQTQADAVISFLESTNVLTLLATRGLGIPVIASELIEPSAYRIKPVWAWLRRRIYPLADRVIVLTSRAIDFFPQALQAKIQAIPAPVPQPQESKVDPAEIPALPGGHRIVAMGRLVEQKGFDLLIEAFAALSGKFPDWSLIIFGEGPLRAELEAQRQRLGLMDRVLLPGLVRNTETLAGQVDLFVLSSRFEGFPMALCEAMAVGFPVLAFDCPTGPKEIIRHEVDGLLVPPDNIQELARSMERLMSDTELRSQLAVRAREIVERFSIDRVADLWETLLADLVAV